MTIEDAKSIIQEFDRLGLELADGLNLLTNAGIISDHVILFGDICNVDGKKCVAFLKGYRK